MATINNSGVAQVWCRDSRTFELDNMRIQNIILPLANWIGFLGFRMADDCDTEAVQYLEIFAQDNLDHCIFDL